MSKFCFTIILLIFVPALVYSQPQQLQFEHITTKDGLSNNGIRCIIQDRQGFMWFGTEQGLNKFDGYNFTAYTYIPEDTNGISAAGRITCVFEDSKGFIWIGTGACLNKFDPLTEKFSHYFHDDKREESLSNSGVRCILEDRYGYIWIGTDNGLNQFDRKTQKFKHFFHDPNNPTSIDLSRISCLYEDSQGDLWIGTGSVLPYVSGGINKFDRKTETFTHYKFEPKSERYSNLIIAITEDASGNLWIGTDHGIYVFNRKANMFTHHYYFDDSSVLSGARNSIKSILIDSKNNVWFGSLGGGLNLLDKNSNEFIQYHNDLQDSYSLSNNKVETIYEDRNGCLWIGTEGGGVDKINPFSNFFRHYRKHISEEKMENVYENNIRAICEDYSGKLWLGSEGGISVLDYSGSLNIWTADWSSKGEFANSIAEDDSGIFWIGTSYGLCKYNPRTRKEKWYTFSESEFPNTTTCNIYTSMIGQQGLLWIGTQQGMYRLDGQDETWTRFVHEPEQITIFGYRHVTSILESSSGFLWVGTLCGLNKFDPGKQIFLDFKLDVQTLDRLKNIDVNVMYEDSLHNLWIGTANGLEMLNQATGSLRSFTQKDGLPNNYINGLLPDDHGNIWISTNSALSEFNPGTNEFKNYDYNDGIRNTMFNSRACLKNKKGEMFFGGNNGLTVFHPDSIKQDLSIPPIVITGFKKFNEAVQLDTSISQIKQLIFSHNENVFSFEFAALNFINPLKNQFAYKMEGFINDWIYLGTKHDVSFTNLNPGKYVFRVKGSNSAGVWNEQGASLKIIILPPWWQTGWAYTLYALILGSIVVGLWRFQVRRIKIRNELKMKSFETQKLQEIDSMKSRFFANISHEFRTPLTLILGPLSKMLSQTKSKEKKQDLKLMQRNARRLQRLINQLLDLSKIEVGKMTLQARPENIVTLLNRIVQSFESQAKLKEIDLKFQSELDEIIVYFDRDKIENIFYNLLSNALKFTAQGGAVSVNMDIPLNPYPVGHRPSKEDFLIPPFEGGPGGMSGFIEITVSDTGIGIPPNRLDKIFDRFYQIDDSYTREQEGSGIGLALTKELVELHHGKIEVNSELSKGTTFTVYFPLGKEHLKQEEIAADQPPAGSEAAGGLHIEEPSEDSESARSDLRPSEGFAPSSHRKALPLILIVEDNRDMRSYLQDCLASDYKVIEAVDGEDGLHRAIDKIPDLIISDVMMPKMDGFVLCERLESDERTSHIPVILLTARASAESKIKGLELGADDYLIKPFDRTELLVRVRNLIEQRQKLREKFSRDLTIQPKDVVVSSYDERFLQRSIDIIEQHISDSEFTVALFSKKVGMSRVQLHRKLQALTNCSAREFIQILRLKRAEQLLQQRAGNITEIAYEVGFNNLSYFSQCFRRQFGKLPSEYTSRKNN
jgi:signal transduction histidine kinase/DNA-binding response OmpR family regulator/streptogramin lyase